MTDPTPVRWVFFGSDGGRALEWEMGLGPAFERLDYGRDLDEAARSTRLPFLQWLERLNRRYGHRRAWWFSRISERNVAASPLFLHVSYMIVLRGRILDNDLPDLIVSESAGLLHAVRMMLRTHRLESRISSSWRLRANMAKLVAVGLAAPAWSTLCCAVPRIVAGRFSRQKEKRRFPPGTRKVLLKTFLYPTDLQPQREIRDRYFTSFHDFLRAAQYEVWVLPLLVGGWPRARQRHKRLHSSLTRLLIPEEWLTLSDCIAAFWEALTSRFVCSTVAPMDGLDITPLVREERWRGGAEAGEASLLSRLPGRLRDAGFRPDQVIAWSENQLHDKALVMGCRTAFPRACYTAVQNTPLPPNMLNLFPSASECELGVGADRQICSGPTPARILSNESHGQLKTTIGCAFRYQHLWDATWPRPGGEVGLSVVLFLPASLAVATEIMQLVAPVATERKNVRWLAKPHPLYSLDQVSVALDPGARSAFTFVSDSIQTCMKAASLVITSGSGTALEAVARGLPVIQVASRVTINLDALAWDNDGQFAMTCHTSEELALHLDRLMSLGAEEQAALRRHGEQVRSAWFQPVTDEAMHEFLASDGFSRPPIAQLR